MRVISGWISNALDRLELIWGEPLTLVVVIGAVVYWWLRIRPQRSRRQNVSYAALALWLVSMIAITTYPFDIDFDPIPSDRIRPRSMIPFADTIQSFGNTRDRVMADMEFQAAVQRLAEDLGLPVEDVNLSPVIRGTPLSVVLKDTIGNVLLFVPLGLLAAPALRLATWRAVLASAAIVSFAVELSQLFLGVGSLASIDDVIYNVAGAALGYAIYLAWREMQRRRTTNRASQSLGPTANI